MTINRLVALLTPLFTAASAIGLGWLSKHFPGLPIPGTEEVVAIEIAGAAAGLAAALKWLHGYQLFEGLVHDAQTWERHTPAQTDHQVAVTAQALAAERQARAALEAKLKNVHKLLGDPYLVLPNSPEITPQSEEQGVVAPDVTQVTEQQQAIVPVIPDVASISPQQQQT